MSSTRANYLVGQAADFVVSFALLAAAFWYDHSQPLASALVVLLGLFIFSFIEYAFHRWLFHGPVPLFEQGHTLHHEKPLGYDSLPFFFPPIVILLIAGALALVLPLGIALLLSGAIALGYALYGFSHLVIHRRRFNHPLARKWAAVHHVHHHHPDKNYGVTSPLWDWLLGTWYVSRSKVR
ncbi:sterol desaturase family protein [Rhodanobacter sp. PCA2]|uniref:sterol desaturase family protein n=1 Tax=Rhodanobacter sp. PCA2 TaxID=2006117 RepID=UPI0021041531|nr:sterol desaturase family protein [Rhodanobacter sp. PCA2]